MVHPFTLIFVFDFPKQKLAAVENTLKLTLRNHSVREYLNQNFDHFKSESFIYKNQLMCMFKLF